MLLLIHDSKIEWDIFVVTVFLSILSQMEFHLVQNRKEHCHHDYIPFDMKGNKSLVFSSWQNDCLYLTRGIKAHGKLVPTWPLIKKADCAGFGS